MGHEYVDIITPSNIVLLSAVPASLEFLHGLNLGDAAVFVQLYNTADPSEANLSVLVPVYNTSVLGVTDYGSPYPWNFGPPAPIDGGRGRPFDVGIVVCLSSDPTQYAGIDDDAMQYWASLRTND